MKKVLFITIIAVMLFSFAACSKPTKEPAVADIIATIKADVTLPEMAEIKKEDIQYYMDIPIDSIKDVSYLMAGDGISSDEIIIVKVADEAKISELIATFEVRKKAQAELFEPYAPEEMPKINSAVIEKKGSYAIFAVTSNNEKVKKIFNDAI